MLNYNFDRMYDIPKLKPVNDGNKPAVLNSDLKTVEYF